MGLAENMSFGSPFSAEDQQRLGGADWEALGCMWLLGQVDNRGEALNQCLPDTTFLLP